RGVEKMLKSEVYLGLAVAGGISKKDDDGESYVTPRYRREGAHEQLVDRATWEAVQRSFGTREPHRDKEPALLAGLLKCSGCGRALYADVAHRQRPKPYPFYTCRNAECARPRPSIGAAALEEWVARLALERLGTVRY